MSRPDSTFWKCPKCGRRLRGASKYHLKSCKGGVAVAMVKR